MINNMSYSVTDVNTSWIDSTWLNAKDSTWITSDTEVSLGEDEQIISTRAAH